jgi:hypothetical protein
MNVKSVSASQRLDLAALGQQGRVADLVFIRIPALPFRKVAAVTGCWTNHVGIIIDTDGRNPIVAESRFPFSRLSSFTDFVARSEGRQVAVARLKDSLTEVQQQHLRAAAKSRLGVLYDTGFDLHSPRQFCSRFVREVVQEATGVSLGEVVTFSSLFEKRPDSDVKFWLWWFFGRIPWNRTTVSPASLLDSPYLSTLFHGTAGSGQR